MRSESFLHSPGTRQRQRETHWSWILLRTSRLHFILTYSYIHRIKYIKVPLSSLLGKKLRNKECTWTSRPQHNKTKWSCFIKCDWHLNNFIYITVRVSLERNGMFSSKCVVRCFDVLLWCAPVSMLGLWICRRGKYICVWALLSSIIMLDRCRAGVRAVCYHLLYEIFNGNCVSVKPPFPPQMSDAIVHSC